MNKKTTFYLFLLNLYIYLPLSGMNQTTTNYMATEHEILNPQLYLSTKRVGGGFAVETVCNGKYIVSNCRPNATKVFFCFSGNFTENNDGFNQKVQILAQNPLSLIDLHTGINKSFRPVLELNNDIPVSALHMLDNEICTVAHDKNIYLLQETWDPRNMLNLFKLELYKYTLKKIQTLSPQLSKNKQDSDTIVMIDSIASLLVTVSKKGFITTWKKTTLCVTDTIHESVQCPQPFFSSTLIHKENLLCLGLNYGYVFIVDITNLAQNKIILIFPQNGLKINLLSSCDNSLFACHLYEDSHSKYEYGDNYFKKNYCKYKIDCCAQHYVTTTCEQCQKSNYAKIYSNEELHVHKKDLLDTNNQLTQQLKSLNAQHCPHTTKAKKNLLPLCYYHQHIENPCEIQHALIDIETLIQQLKKTQGKDIPSTQLNFNTLKSTESTRHDCIKKIDLLPNNQLLVSIRKHRSGEIYVDDTYQVFLANTKDKENAFKIIYNKSSYTIYPIATGNSSFVILKGAKANLLQVILKTITKYTKNSWTEWCENKRSEISRIYYKAHRIPLILVHSILLVVVPLALFFFTIENAIRLLYDFFNRPIRLLPK